MKWDQEKDWIEYKTATDNIKNSLGLGSLDHWTCKHLAPYITRIYQYLNKKLIELGDDADIKDKIDLMLSVFKDGADKIVHEKTSDLAGELDLLDVSENDEVKYEEPRFVFSWTNIMSTLMERLSIQYYELLNPIVQGKCPQNCCCGKQEGQKEWEEYTSGVFPENEIITPSTGSTASTTISSTPCCDRVKTQNGNTY